MDNDKKSEDTPVSLGFMKKSMRISEGIVGNGNRYFCYALEKHCCRIEFAK
jgi:hypothetical protein